MSSPRTSRSAITATVVSLAAITSASAAEPNPGLAPGTYRIASMRVDIEPTNGKGRAWDVKPSPDPDPKAVLSVDGRIVATCRAAETFALSCGVDANIDIDATTELRLEVWDEDALSDDVVGTATLTAPAQWALDTELPMASSGRIRLAAVRLTATPTWWQSHRWHLLAAVGGLIAVVGGLTAYRRGLVRLTPPPPPPRRCAHCEALLDANATVCAHCGARARA